jgi:hypothetical protein
MTVHGLIMLAGGLAFGLAVARAGVLPRWTGIALMAGVILVVAAAGLPNLARTVAAAVPDAAFIGMGLALLRGRLKPHGQQGHVPDPDIQSVERRRKSNRDGDVPGTGLSRRTRSTRRWRDGTHR